MERALRIATTHEEQGQSEVKAQNRVPLVDPDRATDKTRRLFDDVKTRFGIVPNLFRVLGNSPAALEGYLNFSDSLDGGTLDNKVRTQIGLTVAESNLCGYCLSANLFMGNRVGLTQKEIEGAIHASADNPKIDGILKFARSIVVQRGEIPDSDLKRARSAGLTEAEIVETVANVVHNIFMNYLDHVACTIVDFPQGVPGKA